MTTNEIVAALDKEIGILERAKAILSGNTIADNARGRGAGYRVEATS